MLRGKESAVVVNGVGSFEEANKSFSVPQASETHDRGRRRFRGLF
jgi:hypothetical protein